MIIGTLIRVKVYSIIKGFWSLWVLEESYHEHQIWAPRSVFTSHSGTRQVPLLKKLEDLYYIFLSYLMLSYLIL